MSDAEQRAHDQNSGGTPSGPDGSGHTDEPTVGPDVSLTIDRLESDRRIDRLSDRLYPLADKVAAGRRGKLLKGHTIGHALHPTMTDLPIGLWTAASVLDLVGGRRSRPAARRLVALGLAATPATMATGLAEYTTISDVRSGRVATVHAAGNTVAAGLYLMSWWSRVRGRFLRGKLLALGGAVVLSASGYLGGHLAFVRKVGQGQRGLDLESGPDSEAGPESDAGSDTETEAAGTSAPNDASDEPSLVNRAQAAELLTVPVDRVDVMVEQGLLEPTDTDTDGNGMLFDRAAVSALRLLGG